VAIGDEVTIGSESVIYPGVRIYPYKEVESGAQIHSSLIWESRGGSRICGRDGVQGLINVDLTPEMGLRLGAALGTALKRGERATYYLFDEGLSTLLLRSRMLRMDIEPFVASGACNVVQIDPAELSPGEFASLVVDAVDKGGSSFVAIDSLNAYLQAMPGQTFLLLHMHELLTFLNHRAVTTLLIVGQHGSLGEVRTEIDLSYLADATMMFRFFEAEGAVRSALTVVKSRTAANERTIRELRLSQRNGLQIGEPIADFEGVMGGMPRYAGATRMMADHSG